MLLSVTLIGSISVTMMFVLALGEVDLSVASIVAFSGVVASVLITATHSVFVGVVAGVLAGGAVGLVNGTLVARYKINSLIVTLAMMEVVRGLAYGPMIGGMLIIGAGAGLLNGETTKVGMTAIPKERAGMASGVAGTVRFTGLVLGIALLGVVL